MKSALKPLAASLVITLGVFGTTGCSPAGNNLTALQQALDVSTRSDADKARDAGRKPADVLHFLGIGSGMTVMDVMAGSGYYTEVLSLAVGENGTVYAQNRPSSLKWRDGAIDKALTERLADNRLSNVKRIDATFAETGLAANSVDAAITALNFHDLHSDTGEAGVQALIAILSVLKPGGTLGIIDHHGNQGADNAALHRIPVDVVIAAANAAGFEVAGQSDLLSNPEDDRTKMVFDASIRGKTDRFLLRLKKPE